MNGNHFPLEKVGKFINNGAFPIITTIILLYVVIVQLSRDEEAIINNTRSIEQNTEVLRKLEEKIDRTYRITIKD